MPYLVVDTNVILLDANNLVTLARSYPSHTICLPETVVEELDAKKTVLGDIGYQARSFGRMMAKATKLETISKAVNTNGKAIPKITVGLYETEGIKLAIATSPSYPDLDRHSHNSNDSRIIYIAEQLGATLVSNDVMCRIRAEAKQIETTDFKYVEHLDIEFQKTLSVDATTFNSLHNTPITDLSPDHVQNIYSYMFVNTDSGETKLATIHNDLVKIIGKDTEKDLRNQYVNPCNKEQLIFSALVQDPCSDITICEALAGSGKTYLALSNAMKLVDADSVYDSVVYIRNSVDDISNPDEAIGFLKGNDEKMAVYLQPFYDTVGQIVRSTFKSKLKGAALEEFVQEESEKFIQKYNMSAMIALGLRGRTLDNSVIIIDEAQNISKGTMQKILSRVGKNSKVIVIGSLKQIDSKHLTKYTSGLSVLLNATTKTNLPIKLNAVTLNKVVRGPITEFSEIIFSSIKEQ